MNPETPPIVKIMISWLLGVSIRSFRLLVSLLFKFGVALANNNIFKGGQIYMKRFIYFLFVSVLVLVLVGCGGQKKQQMKGEQAIAVIPK